MKTPIIIASLAIALMAGNVIADEYYKWVDDKGVTKYSEQPPVGIASEKVNTYSGSSIKYDPNAANAADEEARKQKAHEEEVANHVKKLEQEEQQKCATVDEQLKTLTERGRVRIKDKDGKERVMTEQEQAAKIEEFKKYQSEMCKKK